MCGMNVALFEAECASEIWTEKFVFLDVNWHFQIVILLMKDITCIHLLGLDLKGLMTGLSCKP